MNRDVVLIIVGSVLLLIGLIGGGITIKDYSVPIVDNKIRSLCGLIGVLLIMGAFGPDLLRYASSGSTHVSISIVVRDDFVGDKEHPDCT
jgi:hypothetical protein